MADTKKQTNSAKASRSVLIPQKANIRFDLSVGSANQPSAPLQQREGSTTYKQPRANIATGSTLSKNGRLSRRRDNKQNTQDHHQHFLPRALSRGANHHGVVVDGNEGDEDEQEDGEGDIEGIGSRISRSGPFGGGSMVSTSGSVDAEPSAVTLEEGSFPTGTSLGANARANTHSTVLLEADAEGMDDLSDAVLNAFAAGMGEEEHGEAVEGAGEKNDSMHQEQTHQPKKKKKTTKTMSEVDRVILRRRVAEEMYRVQARAQPPSEEERQALRHQALRMNLPRLARQLVLDSSSGHQDSTGMLLLPVLPIDSAAVREEEEGFGLHVLRNDSIGSMLDGGGGEEEEEEVDARFCKAVDEVERMRQRLLLRASAQPAAQPAAQSAAETLPATPAVTPIATGTPAMDAPSVQSVNKGLGLGTGGGTGVIIDNGISNSGSSSSKQIQRRPYTTSSVKGGNSDLVIAGAAESSARETTTTTSASAYSNGSAKIYPDNSSDGSDSCGSGGVGASGNTSRPSSSGLRIRSSNTTTSSMLLDMQQQQHQPPSASLLDTRKLQRPSSHRHLVASNSIRAVGSDTTTTSGDSVNAPGHPTTTSITTTTTSNKNDRDHHNPLVDTVARDSSMQAELEQWLQRSSPRQRSFRNSLLFHEEDTHMADNENSDAKRVSQSGFDESMVDYANDNNNHVIPSSNESIASSDWSKLMNSMELPSVVDATLPVPGSASAIGGGGGGGGSDAGNSMAGEANTVEEPLPGFRLKLPETVSSKSSSGSSEKQRRRYASAGGDGGGATATSNSCSGKDEDQIPRTASSPSSSTPPPLHSASTSSASTSSKKMKKKQQQQQQQQQEASESQVTPPPPLTVRGASSSVADQIDSLIGSKFTSYNTTPRQQQQQQPPCNGGVDAPSGEAEVGAGHGQMLSQSLLLLQQQLDAAVTNAAAAVDTSTPERPTTTTAATTEAAAGAARTSNSNAGGVGVVSSSVSGGDRIEQRTQQRIIASLANSVAPVSTSASSHGHQHVSSEQQHQQRQQLLGYDDRTGTLRGRSGNAVGPSAVHGNREEDASGVGDAGPRINVFQSPYPQYTPASAHCDSSSSIGSSVFAYSSTNNTTDKNEENGNNIQSDIASDVSDGDRTPLTSVNSRVAATTSSNSYHNPLRPRSQSRPAQQQQSQHQQQHQQQQQQQQQLGETNEETLRRIATAPVAADVQQVDLQGDVGVDVDVDPYSSCHPHPHHSTAQITAPASNSKPGSSSSNNNNSTGLGSSNIPPLHVATPHPDALSVNAAAIAAAIAITTTSKMTAHPDAPAAVVTDLSSRQQATEKQSVANSVRTGNSSTNCDPLGVKAVKSYSHGVASAGTSVSMQSASPSSYRMQESARLLLTSPLSDLVHLAQQHQQHEMSTPASGAIPTVTSSSSSSSRAFSAAAAVDVDVDPSTVVEEGTTSSSSQHRGGMKFRKFSHEALLHMPTVASSIQYMSADSAKGSSSNSIRSSTRSSSSSIAEAAVFSSLNRLSEHFEQLQQSQDSSGNLLRVPSPAAAAAVAAPASSKTNVRKASFPSGRVADGSYATIPAGDNVGGGGGGGGSTSSVNAVPPPRRARSTRQTNSNSSSNSSNSSNRSSNRSSNSSRVEIQQEIDELLDLLPPESPPQPPTSARSSASSSSARSSNDRGRKHFSFSYSDVAPAATSVGGRVATPVRDEIESVLKRAHSHGIVDKHSTSRRIDDGGEGRDCGGGGDGDGEGSDVEGGGGLGSMDMVNPQAPALDEAAAININSYHPRGSSRSSTTGTSSNDNNGDDDNDNGNDHRDHNRNSSNRLGALAAALDAGDAVGKLMAEMTIGTAAAAAASSSSSSSSSSFSSSSSSSSLHLR